MLFEDLKIGQAMPGLEIPITVALVAGGALATRDYFPGHHDLEAARALGSPHVFMNILTTNGLVQRFVEGWSGPGARFTAVKIKLGAPNDPGDTMRISGEVSALDAAARVAQLTIRGSNSMGNHVTGTVSIMLPSTASKG